MRRSIAATGALVAMLLLAGCASPQPTGSRTATPGASDGLPAPTPPARDIAPTPTPTATSTPSPVALTCETLVTAAALAHLTSGGSRFFPEFTDYAHGDDSGLKPFFDYGGVACQWGYPNSDGGSVLAQSWITTAQAAEQRSRLRGLGWSPATSDGHEDWTNPADADPFGYRPTYRFEPTGTWKYVLFADDFLYFAR